MANYTTLLWRMDNTLFDTEGAIRAALTAALADYDVKAPCIAPLANTDTPVQMAAEQYTIPVNLLRHAYTRHYKQILLRDQPPFPDVIRVCQWMVEQGGTNVVYTARTTYNLELFLAAYGMTGLFHRTWTADDGYPHYTGLEHLLQHINTPPSRVVLIANNAGDIQRAKALGLHACAFGKPAIPGADWQASTCSTLITWFIHGRKYPAESSNLPKNLQPPSASVV